VQVYGIISPIQAPIHSLIVIWHRENPVKASFSVPVENTLNYRFVCQNNADLCLSQRLPMALQPKRFLPLTITHLNHETLPERQCEGRFFPTSAIKMRELNEKRHTALLIIRQLLRWHFFRHINQALNPNGKKDRDVL
jgi:hypothetical protein